MPLSSGLQYAPLPPGQIGIVERLRWATSEKFIHRNYRHFNAGALMEAAVAYEKHLLNGGQMLVTLAGAMSTAELGVSLAEMIREGKVHAISCTGANLEEDLFNLVAHDDYVRALGLSRVERRGRGEAQAALYRVTDTCIPEDEAVRRLEMFLLEEWITADRKPKPEAYFPHEFLYRILLAGRLEQYYDIEQANESWLLAAAQKGLPIFVPGWEDSTLGNTFASHVISGEIENRSYGSHRHRVHGCADRLVSGDVPETLHWVLPDRRRHSRGFPHLRGAHARTEPAHSRCSTLGLFLPDQ